MRPSEYFDHLETVADRERLKRCELRPVSPADIMSVEREAGRTLPEEYADFLCEVGAGTEHGGLARWYHVDITRSGNVLDVSQHIAAGQIAELRQAGRKVTLFPRGLLAIYDALDGEIFGFIPNGSSNYRSQVYVWDCEEQMLEEVAPDFYLFLDYLAEADEDVNGPHASNSSAPPGDELDALFAELG